MVTYSDGGFHPMQHGLVYRNNGRWLCIAANGGTLIVENVTDADGNDVLAKIRTGDRLSTPYKNLEQRNVRPQISATGIAGS